MMLQLVCFFVVPTFWQEQFHKWTFTKKQALLAHAAALNVECTSENPNKKEHGETVGRSCGRKMISWIYPPGCVLVENPPRVFGEFGIPSS